MAACPDCGRELPAHDRSCPSTRKPSSNPYTIQTFLWENFRRFTMVGVTGTMISLIPNTGTRILGLSWITGPNNYLPLLLSIIIFFGTIFLTICFLMIFSLIFRDRELEEVRHRVRAGSGTLMRWYEGDLQRFILLACLVPMWFGLTLFFLMLMPLIPNQYSWIFAAVAGLTLLPLVLYSLLGWKIGKIVVNRLPVLKDHASAGIVLIAMLIVILFLLGPYVVPMLFWNTAEFSGNVRIHPDQQYFSPGISSAEGLRLTITNLSGREVLGSRQAWSADYGYFIRVTPSTGEVTILGNPVTETGSREIYWTYPAIDSDRTGKPVTIQLRVLPPEGDDALAVSSLTLDWYTDRIVKVNNPAGDR